MVRIFARVLTAALFAVVFSACDGNLGADELVKRAEAHRAEGKPRTGLIELKNALQKSPENVGARLLLADISLQIGDAFSAERELLWARGKAERGVVEPALARAWLALGKTEQLLKEITANPEDPPVVQATILGLRGQAYLASARIDQAQTEFARASELDPAAAQLVAGKAQLAWRQQDLAGAGKLAEEAARAAPQDFGIGALRADILLASGDAAGAEEAWKNLSKLSENSVPARVGLARALLAEDKLPEAVKELDAVLKAAPRSAVASHLRGLAAYRTKDYAAAKAFSEKALSAAGDHMPTVLLAGAASYALEQYEQANRYLQRYITEVPGNAGARKLLAQTQLRLGRTENAIATLKAGLKQNPEDAQLLALVGAMVAKDGDLRAGGNYLQRAVALAPDNPRLRANLGLTKIALGQEEGVEDLEKAIEMDPNLTQAEVTLITAQLRAGKFQEALERAQRLQGEPNTAPAGFLLAGSALAGLRKLDEAEASYRKVLELQPANIAARSNLAMLAAEKGQFDAARSLLEEALKLQPDHLGSLLRLSLIEAAAGRREAQRQALERAVEAHPDAAVPRVLLGRYHLLTGDPAAALSIVEPVREKEQQDPRVLDIIGRAQLGLGRIEDAVTTFLALVKLHPESARGHLLLAQAYGALGNVEKQRGALERAVASQPDDFPARLELTRFTFAHHDMEKAQELLGRLQADFPRQPAVYDLAGDIAIAQNHQSEALSAYEMSWKIAPNTLTTTKLARLRWAMRDRDGSDSMLEEWLKKYPQDSTARLLVASQYIEIDKLKEAKAHLVELIHQTPDSAVALNNLAWVLHRSGENDAALTHATRASELAPESAVVMDTLGLILLDKNESARAVELLRKAVEKSGNEPGIRYHYALALSQTGKEPVARDMLKELLTGNTAFSERAQAEALLKKLGGS